MSKMQRTQIYLEDSQIAALDARARAKGVTRSDLIREAVDQALANDNNKPTLLEVLRRIGPLNSATANPKAMAKNRAALDAELDARISANRRRNARK
jgi:metal-responsive CopG/Arc/MetJ family transcriptional regulator